MKKTIDTVYLQPNQFSQLHSLMVSFQLLLICFFIKAFSWGMVHF